MHGLAELVVQLGRAGVQRVRGLGVEPLAGREAPRERQGGGGAAVLAPEPVELGGEAGVFLGRAPAGVELVERRDQRLGDVAPAVVAIGHRASVRRNAVTDLWSVTALPARPGRLN